MAVDDPAKLVAKALDDELVSLGKYTTHIHSGEMYCTMIPKVAADTLDVGFTSEWEKYLDAETGAIVSVPAGALEEDVVPEPDHA